MFLPSREITMCQLAELNMMCEKLHWYQKCWQLLTMRIPRWVKNRMYQFWYNIVQRSEKNPKNPVQYSSPNLQPGDWVIVRSKNEVLSTLDQWKRCRGCKYMDNMWQYCGGKFKVLKTVDNMLDERELKMKNSRAL